MSLSIITGKQVGAMKEIDKGREIFYVTHPSRTHTSEQLAALHACIRYTHAFKHDESMQKMTQTEVIERVLPKI